MTTLRLSFPGRRYHATPWGHHVNEGLVEWPPSPWRLLRALLSVGFTALRWPVVPPEGRALVEALAPVLPKYHLPPAVGAHSRHYMPAPLKTTLVFDTWAQVDDGILDITWPVDLPPDQHRLLGELADRLNYLGRSESWVEARLLSVDPTEEANCWPEHPDQNPRAGCQQVPLLAPISSESYSGWRIETLAALTSKDAGRSKGTPARKPSSSTRLDVPTAYPPDLVACLLSETSFLRSHGWSQPPGSRKVFYWRSAGALEAGAPRPSPVAPKVSPVECMLLSFATSSNNDHALPSMTRVLPQGERLHRALVARCGGASPVLTGCDTDRKPLSGHRHASLLHLDLDGDAHLDHCLIWAPGGLDGEAQAAIREVRRTYAKGSLAPLHVAVAGSGKADDLRMAGGGVGAGLERLFGPKNGARTWVSVTPFVAPRFIKRSGKNSLAGQVAAELTSRGMPPAQVELLDLRESEYLRFRHFVRVRGRGSPPPVNCGFPVRLTFSEPVRGPISLGYASHFGLGLFLESDVR